MPRKQNDKPLPTDNDIISVGDFTSRVKHLLESTLPPCWVRGEVSNLRRQSSGHVYFTLKDDRSQLQCVMFRGNAAQQSVELKEGSQFIVFGEVSLYEPRGSYQLIVRWIVQDGVGRLQQAFEQLKQKLSAEGLFDSARKKPIPQLPRTVGYLTSPTGAAVRDFISILKRRGWRGRLIILPAKVQGDGAAAEMTAMLKRAEASGIFDLIVVGRGGGSLEDLWQFNEEVFVRAIAECRVPIISGVGHEIDFTLSDFVADLRAETPSGAAELISSGFLECVERFEELRDGMIDSSSLFFERQWNRLERAEGRLKAASPKARLEHANLRLDELTNRLNGALRERLSHKQQRIQQLALRLGAASPEAGLQYANLRLENLASRYLRLTHTALRPHQERMYALGHRLQTSSINDTLRRGYAILQRNKDEVVSRAAQAQDEELLIARMSDGELSLQVNGKKTSARKKPARRKRSEDERQSELGF